MPKFENQGFSSKKRIDNEKRDRSVPENENYYDFTPIDLNFNNREREITNDNQDSEKYDDIFDYQVDINSYNQQPTIPTEYEDFDSGLPQDEPVEEKIKKPKKKKSKGKAIVPIIAVLLVILIVPVFLINSVLGKINYTDSQSQVNTTLHSDANVKNILLLGVDARSDEESESSRADTMMLITIDGNNKCIKMTSFLRDTWVYIPAKDGNQRLNAACSYGGYQGVVDTIEYNFGVDIDGYVVADFEMFKVLVDSIGGVEVEVTEKEAKEVTKHKKRYGGVKLEAGTNTLSGEQALAYCRIRKIDSDFERTKRQRTVITAILNKVKSSNPITLYSMVSNAAPYLETSISKTELMNMALSAVSCLTGDMVQEKVPFDGTWSYQTINGNSVIGIDVEENKEMLIDYLYNKSAEEIKAEQE